MHDFSSWMNLKKDAINRQLEIFCDDGLYWSEGLEGSLVESCQYALLGKGKRLRSLLCCMTADLFKGSEQDALYVSLSLEMIHAYSLVHDDMPCMDDDLWRRGQPTVHVKYNEWRALLVGDALLTVSFEYLLTVPLSLDSEKRIHLMRVLSRASGPCGMILGQDKELDMSKSCDAHTDIEKIILLKTGALFKASILMGYILSVEVIDEHDCRILSQFSDNISIAFQIIDDLQDLQQDASHNNKKNRYVGGYIRALGKENARKEAYRLLNEAYNIWEHTKKNGPDNKLQAFASWLLSLLSSGS